MTKTKRVSTATKVQQQILNQENRKTEATQKQKAYEDSIKQACTDLKLMIRDPKYKGYKFLLQTKMASIRSSRKALRTTAKSIEDYARMGLQYDAEIDILESILLIPERFVAQLKNIQKRKKNGKNA